MTNLIIIFHLFFFLH